MYTESVKQQGHSQNDRSTSLPIIYTVKPTALQVNPLLYIYTQPHTTRAHGWRRRLSRLNSCEMMYVESVKKQ